MHAKDRFARKALEQTVVDHSLRAGAAFFGRLEDEVHDAVEAAMQRQPAGAGQQHRGVSVVTAGMHAAFVLRGMIEGVVFLQGQGVHVGSQPDRPGRAATAQGADDAGAAHAGRDLDAPGSEFGGDQGSGAVLLIAKLGMRVDVAPDRLDFRLQIEDSFCQHHDGIAPDQRA